MALQQTRTQKRPPAWSEAGRPFGTPLALLSALMVQPPALAQLHTEQNQLKAAQKFPVVIKYPDGFASGQSTISTVRDTVLVLRCFPFSKCYFFKIVEVRNLALIPPRITFVDTIKAKWSKLPVAFGFSPSSARADEGVKPKATRQFGFFIHEVI